MGGRILLAEDSTIAPRLRFMTRKNARTMTAVGTVVGMEEEAVVIRLRREAEGAEVERSSSVADLSIETKQATSGGPVGGRISYIVAVFHAQ